MNLEDPRPKPNESRGMDLWIWASFLLAHRGLVWGIQVLRMWGQPMSLEIAFGDWSTGFRSLYTYIHTYVRMHVRAYVHTLIHNIQTDTHTRKHRNNQPSNQTNKRAYMHIHMHAYIHMHTHT